MLFRPPPFSLYFLQTLPDSRTVAYAIAAQPVFDDLRQVAAQLAGMLVLFATGAKTAAPDHPMLTTASQVFAQASDALLRVQPPAIDTARQHYDAVTRAVAALGAALSATQRELGKPTLTADLDAALGPLRLAYDCLQQAASMLPGFQMVSFEQACCGANLSAGGQQVRQGLLHGR